MRRPALVPLIILLALICIASAGATEIEGTQTDALFGFSQAVGDFNGDGMDDLVVGAPNNDNSGTDRGAAFIFLGPFSGDLDTGDANGSYIGEEEYDRAGFALAAGDVNGDGYDDIIVGSPGNDDNLPNSGQVYVIFGRRNFTTQNSLSEANGSFIGKDNSDRIGMALACGDVNGDRYDDVIIGTPREDGDDGANSGAVYIIHGKSGSWNMEKSLYNADASYVGTALGQRVGLNVTCGDVNGDGMSDILIGAPYHTRSEFEEGMVYIAFGRTSSWKLNIRVNTLNASFLGGTAGAHLGWSLSAGFDADGDELGDILIGAPGLDGAYMFRGRQGWGRRIEPHRADIEVEGDPGTRTGWSVAMDIYDRDLVRGLIVGSPGNDTIDPSFAFLPNGTEGDLPNSTIVNGTSESLYGWSIVSGDMDLDGLKDAVVSAPNATGPSSRTGVVEIVEYAMNIQPFISDLTLHKNISRPKAFFLRMDQPVMINATGGSGGPNRDVVWARVTTTLDSTGIMVPLLETGGSTGHFLGNVTPVYGSDEDAARIAARWGNWLYVSFGGPVRARGMLNVPPAIEGNDTLWVDEDSPYESRYTYDDGNADEVSWTIDTNATWMIWSEWNQTLWGTPDNRHVGWFNVNISIDDGNFGNDTRSFILTVNNTPPVIGNADETTAYEDIAYNVTYYVSPPEIGAFWTFTTNASWLDFEQNGTYLFGTPNNTDVGVYSVNISVYDGNGGSDHREFDLDVLNTPLMILTTDVLSVDQDEYYYNDYDSTDDPGPEWTLWTDADFLDINTTSGEIFGVPDNWDVGNWTVNISVEDIHGAIDFSNFTLQVFNLAPVISLHDPIIAFEDDDFSYTLNFTDKGPGTTVTMVTDAVWLSDLDLTISGRADDDDVGDYYFDLTVNDTWGAASRVNVTLRVLNTDPVVLGTPPNSTYEDSHYMFNLSSSDPVDFWTYSGPSWLNLDANGTLYGIPINDDVGNHTITVTVFDRHGGSGTLQYDLWVINRPPEIAAEHVSTVAEGEQFNAWFNSSDPGGWWRLDTSKEWLNLTDSGVLSGIPKNRDVGKWTINITAGDRKGARVTYVFNLTVTNTPPVIHNTPPALVLEDDVYSFDMNSSDDPWVEWELISLTDWLEVNGTGSLYGVPGNEYVALWQFTLIVDDGNGGKDWLNFTVDVRNTDPEILSTPPGFAWEKDLYYFQMVSSDGGPIGWELVGPPWLYIDPATGLMSGTPTNDDVNDTNVTITLKDGKGGRATHEFILQVFNTDPVILTEPINTTIEGLPFGLALRSTDDGENTVWRVWTDAYWLTYNTTVNSVYGTPGELVIGTYYINMSVKDGFGASDYLNFTLEVINAPPVLSIPYIPPLPEDEPFEAMIRSSDPVSLWEFSSDSDWLGFNTTSGRLHGTPDNSDVGTWTANVTATDGYGMSASVELTIIVENTPPDITPYPPLELVEEQLYRVDFNTTDTPESWTFEGPSWLTIDEDSGILWGVPGDADFGAFEVTVNVSDGNGGYAELPFVIDVENINDAPVIAGTDVPVTNATEPYLVEYIGTDPDGDTTTWGLVTNATFLSISTNGTLTGLPTNDNEGAYPVSIFLRDPSGNTTWRNFTLIVLYKDLAPTLNGGTVTPNSGDTDTRFHFTVWYFDPEGAPPASIMVVIDGKELPMKLSEEEASNGLYRFTTDLSRGVHTYYFRANDGTSQAEATGGTPTETNAATVGVKKGEDLSNVIFYDIVLIAVLVAILVIALGYLVAPDRMSGILGRVIPSGGTKRKRPPATPPSEDEDDPDPFHRPRRDVPPPRRRTGAVRPMVRSDGPPPDGEEEVREGSGVPEDPGPEIGPERTRSPSGSGRVAEPIEEDETDPLDMEGAVAMRYSDLPKKRR